MIDLRALRQQIAAMDDPKAVARVSRDWLQQVEADLTAVALERSKEARQ